VVQKSNNNKKNNNIVIVIIKHEFDLGGTVAKLLQDHRTM